MSTTWKLTSLVPKGAVIPTRRRCKGGALISNPGQTYELCREEDQYLLYYALDRSPVSAAKAHATTGFTIITAMVVLISYPGLLEAYHMGVVTTLHLRNA